MTGEIRVLVIEHNLDVIKVADHIIDLGPEGGDGGGEIFVRVTPEDMVKVKESHTAKFLKEELKLNTMKRILIDMDEVIADPMGEMISWYKKTYGGDFDLSKTIGGSWVKGFPEQHQHLIRAKIVRTRIFQKPPGDGRQCRCIARNEQALRDFHRIGRN